MKPPIIMNHVTIQQAIAKGKSVVEYSRFGEWRDVYAKRAASLNGEFVVEETKFELRILRKKYFS